MKCQNYLLILGVLGIFSVSTGDAFAIATIDNGTPSGTLGHFSIAMSDGGESWDAILTAPRLNSTDIFTENILFDYLTYIKTDNDVFRLESTTTVPAFLSGDDEVTSSGSFTGLSGQTIQWTAISSITLGEQKVVTTYTFTSTSSLGNLRLYQYLDEDIEAFEDCVFYTRGSVTGFDLELFTVDNVEVYGISQFSQSGAFSVSQGLVNSGFVGWAADTFNNMIPRLNEGTQIVLITGIIESGLAASPIAHPVVGVGFGPEDIVSVMAWEVNPSKTSATIVTSLGGIINPDSIDLRLDSVSAVQAIFNPDSLVDSKKTRIKVDVTNTGKNIIENVGINLVYQAYGANGQLQNFDRTDLVPISPGTRSYYLPLGDFISPGGNVFAATVTIDSGDDIDESNESNNVKETLVYPVKKTNPYRILYVPIHLPGQEAPSRLETKVFADVGTEYLQDIFPLGEPDISYDFSRIPLKFLPTLNLDDPKLDIIELTLLFLKQNDLIDRNNFDKMVGVVKQGWFSESTTQNWVAAASPVSDFVIVEKQLIFGGTTAQELAHTESWVTIFHSDNIDLTNTGHFGPNKVEDYYWLDRDLEKNSCDFMVRGCPDSVFSAFPRFWISKDTFEYLFDKFKEDPTDPAVIAISGIIFQDGTVIENPWYRLEGTQNIPLNNPGEYTIQYLDSNDNVIAQTGFDLDFAALAHNETEFDFAGFALRIPDVQNTNKIVIKKAEQVLQQRTISLNPPQITVTNPNGGEVFEQGNTINTQWTSADIDNDSLTHFVSLSTDAGITWVPISSETTENEISFVVTTNIHTSSALIRVTTTDGVNTSTDVSDAVFFNQSC